MHSVNLDDANVASQRAAERMAAHEAGFTILGVTTSQLLPGDRLIDRTGREPWKGCPTVKGLCPDFGGGWHVSLRDGFKPVRLPQRRISIWRPAVCDAA